MASIMPAQPQQGATYDEVWAATMALKASFTGRSLPSAQIVRVKDWRLQYKQVRGASTLAPRKQFVWTAPTDEVLQSPAELRAWFDQHARPAAAAASPAGPAARATFAHTTGTGRKRTAEEAAEAAAVAAPNFAAAAALAKKASFVGTKGGVGKSTSCKQVSAAIAEQRPDQKIAVVDLDPQCHQAFRVVGQERYPHTDVGGGFYEVFEYAMRSRQFHRAELGRRLEQAMRPTQQPNVSVLFASNTQVNQMEVQAQANWYQVQVAWTRITKLLEGRFDMVFFDTPGTQTSNLLPLALSSSELAVLVTDGNSEYTKAETLTTADKCRVVKELHNPALKLGVVLNKVDGRTSVAAVAERSREMAGVVGAALGGEVHELGALRLSTTALKKTEGGAPLALARSLPPGGDAVLPELHAIGAAVVALLGA